MTEMDESQYKCSKGNECLQIMETGCNKDPFHCYEKYDGNIPRTNCSAVFTCIFDIFFLIQCESMKTFK